MGVLTPALDSSDRSPQSVALRPLQSEDLTRIRRWLRDPVLLSKTVLVPGPAYRPAQPYSDSEADRYFGTLVAGANCLAFAIIEDGIHVGNVGLKNIDMARGQAECFIEIGEPMVRGRGVGTKAMHLLMDRAFGEMGLRKLYLGVFEFNHAAIQMYTRLGFLPAQRYGWHYVDGCYHQVLGMSLEAPWQEDSKHWAKPLPANTRAQI